eukprot:jgi/Ulvmu1/10428/UM062_0024.1
MLIHSCSLQVSMASVEGQFGRGRAAARRKQGSKSGRKLLVLTKAIKAGRQASRLSALLRGLVPLKVHITPMLGPDGRVGCPGGVICFEARWRSPFLTPRLCPLHAGDCGISLHTQVCQAAMAVLIGMDKGACMLPEFRIRIEKRDAQGRFASGPTHSIDLLVVFSSGQVVAFEFDGASHDNRKEQDRDYEKECMLQLVDVPCCRVRMVQCSSKQRCSALQQVHSFAMKFVYDLASEQHTRNALGSNSLASLSVPPGKCFAANSLSACLSDFRSFSIHASSLPYLCCMIHTFIVSDRRSTQCSRPLCTFRTEH